MHRSRPNLTTLIKEELVKRFDSVVRDEIKRHDLSVERADKDISLLKELFIGFKTEHEKLRIQHEASFKKTQDLFTKECRKQQNDFEGQRRFIKENYKKVGELVEDFKKNIDEFVSTETFNEYGTYVDEYFLDLNKHICKVSSVQDKNFHKSELKVMTILEESQQTCNQNLEKLNETMESLKGKFEEYRVDAVGILKEIQVYKKTAFIMQKKIENLYTLIDRLNNRVKE